MHHQQLMIDKSEDLTRQMLVPRVCVESCVRLYQSFFRKKIIRIITITIIRLFHHVVSKKLQEKRLLRDTVKFSKEALQTWELDLLQTMN